MSLRVAFDARPLDIPYLRSQGIGRYTAALLQQLPEVAAEQDGELVILRGASPASAQFGQDALAPTIRVRRPRLPERLTIVPEQVLLRRDLSRARVDVLHAPAIFRAALFPGVPSVLTVHDVIPLLFRSDYQRTGLLYRALFSAVRRATLILADSQKAKDDIVEQLDLPTDRVEVVPCGVDPRFTPVDPQPALGRLNLTTPYILYVGGLEGSDPRKRVDGLIREFARWSADREETLVLTGRLGPAAEPLRALAASLRARVRFTDFVDESDLPALYSGARCLVSASRYEGFGLPALEALACGTPVAAFAVGALPEVAGPGALLEPDGDMARLMAAVQRLCDEPELRARLGQAGRQHAGQFSWRRTAELAWRGYERAASEFPPVKLR